jgi:hypothetical protein
LQNERKSGPGNLIAYLTAVIRAVKYIQCPGSEEILDTWQHLSQASKWLHWKEVLAVVKQQREVSLLAAPWSTGCCSFGSAADGSSIQQCPHRQTLGSFKTVRSAGVQRIPLEERQSYFLGHLRKYLKKLRPRLLEQVPHNRRTHTVGPLQTITTHAVGRS